MYTGRRQGCMERGKACESGACLMIFARNVGSGIRSEVMCFSCFSCACIYRDLGPDSAPNIPGKYH
jgi:hypothetical protein